MCTSAGFAMCSTIICLFAQVVTFLLDDMKKGQVCHLIVPDSSQHSTISHFQALLLPVLTPVQRCIFATALQALITMQH